MHFLHSNTNSAFFLQRSIDYLHKYFHFFLEGQLRDIESLVEFVATETWLRNSPPVIGQIYKQFVQDCYQKNHFMKNEMVISGKNAIDLGEIKHHS
jgi:polyhydroxyalkanoate synthase subunit PhaC